MPAPDDSLIQECTTCGALIDVSGEEPFALMHCPTCGAAMRVRTRFDHFELQELLGAGGMGAVYRAHDSNLHRSVALKLLQQQHSADPEFVAKFQKEAAITASINHPHVVKVYSTGRDHGLVYIAMELVDKGSLESLMHAEKRVAELHVLNVGIQIAQGLNAALERGLIHRDIKPGNILFANATTAKIVDFGLAILMEHSGAAAGEVWATPFYVSPETVDGQPEDFRSDMYSLGATLFHALAGRPPHQVETNSMSELAAAKAKPVNLQAVAADVSSTTAFVLNKVLSRDPAERYQSYAEFIEHLEFARTELLEAMQHAQAKAGAEDGEKSERDYGWLTFGVAATIVLGGVLFFQFGDRFFPKAPVVAAVEETPRSQQRIDVRYEEARKLLIAGDAAKAADAFAKLDAETSTPQPLQNWITLHAGLAELFAGRLELAQERFAALETRGVFSPDPAEEALANFFVGTAHQAGGTEVIPAAAAKDVDRTGYATIALLLFGVKDWTLGQYDEAWQLFREFSISTPQEHYVWISAYKPLVSPYLEEISAFRSAVDAAKSAGTLEGRKQALRAVKETKVRCKIPSQFPAKLEVFENELQQKITVEEEETARRMAEMDAADAKALTEARSKIAVLWQQFRPGEAEAVARAMKVASEKGITERDNLVKKMGWLAKFKLTLIADINTVGYPGTVLKKTGVQMPGPVRRANETQIESIIPFGSLTAPWTDLSADGILAMGKSFLRAGLPAEVLADRQWQLGVYAFYTGKAREGRELLIQASQAKPEYREDLDLFLETAGAQ